MNFAQAMKNESTHTYTENGARAKNTSSNALVDLFGTIGSLRQREDLEVTRIFGEAYKADPLLATKIAFYARDVRGGLGERKVFRTIIKYLAQYHPEAIRPNIDLIGVYGRYDDLYELIRTPVEDDMWKAMKSQFEEDLQNLKDDNAVSLLGKWIKTPDASSKNTRALGILTAKKLGYSVYEFKRHLRALRKRIDIVERHLSAKEYDQIKYSEVPSRAMLLYRNSFMRNDSDRYNSFIAKAVKGEAKINSATLYPYDIVKGMLKGYGWRVGIAEDAALEAQWRQLPNYVEPNTNALVISDLSGSMTCNNYMPLASSIGLAIYFAERNHGAYENLFIPFSSSAHACNIKGETLAQKIEYVIKAGNDYCGSTNLEAAFDEVLNIAVKNRITPEDMVKSLIVISDMEIDSAVGTGGWYSTPAKESWSFYEDMKERFERAGYDIPNVVFWNVNSRHDIFHADANRTGVQLCSGQSASTFKQLMGCIGYTPVEMMLQVINSERYSAIKVG